MVKLVFYEEMYFTISRVGLWPPSQRQSSGAVFVAKGGQLVQWFLKYPRLRKLESRVNWLAKRESIGVMGFQIPTFKGIRVFRRYW